MRKFLSALFFSLLAFGAFGQQTLTLTAYSFPDGQFNLANFKLRAVFSSQIPAYSYSSITMERGFIFSNSPVNPFDGLTTFAQRQNKVATTQQIASGTWADATSPTSPLAFPNDFKHSAANIGISTNTATPTQGLNGRWGFQHTSTGTGVTLRTGGRYYVTAYFYMTGTSTFYWSNTVAFYTFDEPFAPNGATAVGCAVDVNYNDYPNENVSPTTFQGFDRFYNYYDIDGNLIDINQTPTTQAPFSVENGYYEDINGDPITTLFLSSFEVNIAPLPLVTAPENQTVCAGSLVTLSGGGATSYHWDNGIINGVGFSASTTQTYTVSGTDDNGCTNTAYTIVTVNALPTVSATANQTVCSGTSVTLSGSGAVSYTWTGGISDGVAFTPSVGVNTYTVTGTDGNGCTNTATRSVTVNALPSVSATANQTVCEGTSVTLSGSGATGYSWTGGISNGVAFIPSVGVNTYTVTGTDDNGCTNTATRSVTVNALPSVSATANQTVCEGTSVTLSGSGAVSYTWTGGISDGVAFTPSVGVNTYTVTGTDGNGCTNTATRSVTVNALPNYTFQGNSSICLGQNTDITVVNLGGVDAIYHNWSTNATTATVNLSPTTTTTFSYTGSASNGCSKTQNITITVNSLPNVSATANQTVCEGTSVTLSGSGATSYSWTGGISNGVAFTPSVGVNNYTVTGTDGNGCTNTATRTVTVNANGWTGSAGTVLINGVQAYDLNDVNNWCGGLPSSPTVPNGVTVYIDGFQEFTNLTIECGGAVIITETGRVNITNVFYNGGLVQVINGATIKYGSTVSGSCQGTYKTTETFTPSRYWYVGPTTSVTQRSAFGSVASSANPTGTQMWSWNESLNATNGYVAPIYNNGYLIPGNGYVYRNLGGTSLVVDQIGPYVTSDVNKTLTRTANTSLSGYHLISNPYTAYLDLDQVFNVSNQGTNNVQPSVWVRTNLSSTGNETQMVFDTYNPVSGLATGLGWQLNAIQGNNQAITSLMRYIAPMQGFWVRVNAGASSGNISYNYNMASANPIGAGQLRTTSPIEAMARINVQFGDQKDQFIAALSPSAQNGFDAYDSEKMFTSGVVQAYTPNSGKKLVINTLKNNKSKVSMPVTVECPANGWYSFELLELQLEAGVLLLEDKLEGVMHDLTLDTSYQFYANSGVLSNRFVLHFNIPLATSNPTGPSSIEDLVSESHNAQIEISANSTGKVTVELSQADESTSSLVRIVDINGKVLESFNGDGLSFDFQISQGQGIYIVEVSNGLTTEKKKVFIQ